MSRAATVELDFFGMEKANNSNKSQFQKFLHRRQSFRGFHGAISKMNPELIKSVISTGSTNPRPIDWKKSFSVPSSPKEDPSNALLPLPTLDPALRSTCEDGFGTAPLTIFYNGTVSVINVPRDKAESILKLAAEGSSKKVESADSSKAVNSSSDQQNLLEARNGDLPIARRKSLQRFLEKRKERLTCASPYAW